MTDLRQPSQEVFAREYEYIQKWQEYDSIFDEFLGTIPPDRQDLVIAVQGLHFTKPEHILDRNKKEKLKVESPEVYKEIVGLHKKFLESKMQTKAI